MSFTSVSKVQAVPPAVIAKIQARIAESEKQLEEHTKTPLKLRWERAQKMWNAGLRPERISNNWFLVPSSRQQESYAVRLSFVDAKLVDAECQCEDFKKEMQGLGVPKMENGTRICKHILLAGLWLLKTEQPLPAPEVVPAKVAKKARRSRKETAAPAVAA